jgi:hypothetical protein
MKRNAILSFALAALLFTQTACTPSQIDQVIADVQIGVDAASVAAPLVLAAFAPEVAAPVAAYLGVADQVFADIARVVSSDVTAGEKASAIATEIAVLVAQNPSQILPPNSPPQLVAEVEAIANAAQAVAGLFPPAAVALSLHPHFKGKAAPKLKLSASQAARVAQIEAQAQAELAFLATKR